MAFTLGNITLAFAALYLVWVSFAITLSGGHRLFGVVVFRVAPLVLGFLLGLKLFSVI